MYRIFLLLCLILHVVCKADEDIISDYSNSLSSLEGDPNSIIYNCVNVITGDYIDMETDIELPGVESMNLRRFYCSSNNSEHWFRSWHFNHDMSIRKNKNGNPSSFSILMAKKPELAMPGMRSRNCGCQEAAVEPSP